MTNTNGASIAPEAHDFEVVLHRGQVASESAEGSAVPLPMSVRVRDPAEALALVRGMRFRQTDDAIRDSVRTHVAELAEVLIRKVDAHLEKAGPPHSVTGEGLSPREVVAREILLGLSGLVGASPTLLDPLKKLMPQSQLSSSGPLLMRKKEYADHIAVGVRTLDKLIAMGLPTVGAGKLVRIPVAEADVVVGELLAQQGGKDDDDAIERLARQGVDDDEES